MKLMRGAILLAAFWLLSPPLVAADRTLLTERVQAMLDQTGPGTRIGLVVATEDGREIVAIRPNDRFIPASNTKMFTTAVAFDALNGLDQPDAAGGAAVRLEDGDAILVGHGDARLSSAADCLENCLSQLADAVAAKTRTVRDVVGDDSLFPDQRWSPGMSWNNIPSRSGTATSALTLDDNELAMTVAPSSVGAPPNITLALPYYTIENRAVTLATGKTTLDFDRAPNGFTLRLFGTIAQGAPPEELRMGIDDPAYYAAWRFKALLEARGVRVTGKIAARHRPLMPADDPKIREGAPPVRASERATLAQLTPPPLADDIRTVNKVSQNLHAELLLRRVALQAGTGSIADGIAQIEAMLMRAGVPRTAWDLSDGSGMSTYNRVAPRGMVILLRWISTQPWGAAWRATLPVAGSDGTLAKRFKGSPLEKRLFAKTGTLNATNALSGYMIAKSGRTLIFSIYANDVPEGVAATAAMDAALNLVAAEN